jgi:hypothetical protein
MGYVRRISYVQPPSNPQQVRRSPVFAGSAWARTDGGAPSVQYQVKANRGTMTFCSHRSALFDSFPVEMWFRTEHDAMSAGFVDAAIGGSRAVGSGVMGRLEILLAHDDERMAALRAGDDRLAKEKVAVMADDLMPMLDEVEAVVQGAGPQNLRDLVRVSAFRLLPMVELADLFDVPLTAVEEVVHDLENARSWSAEQREQAGAAIAALRAEVRRVGETGDHQALRRIRDIVVRLFEACVFAAIAGLIAAGVVAEPLAMNTVKDTVVALVMFTLLTVREVDWKQLAADRAQRRGGMARAVAHKDRLVAGLTELGQFVAADRHDGADPRDLALLRMKVLLQAQSATLAVLDLEFDQKACYWRTLTAVSLVVATEESATSARARNEIIRRLGRLELAPVT